MTIDPHATKGEIAGLTRAAARLPETVYTRHLRSRLALRNYARIANDVVSHLPQGRVLDWGAGFGQLSYLLRRRGLSVIGYDYRPNEVRGVRATVTALDSSVPLMLSDDPIKLPFVEESFDGVISCGVLEHVDDEHASLEEIWRVLQPNGLFLVYQLPQEWSYLEYIVRRFKLGYAHERRYTARGIRKLLTEQGFAVETVGFANMLPKTFTGLPNLVRRGFDLVPGPLISADQGLSRVPGLNRIAGVLEVVARKTL